MKAPLENTQEQKKETVQSVQQEPTTGGTAMMVDNRPSAVYQRKLRSAIDASPTNDKPVQRKVLKGSSRFQQIATSMGEKYGVNTSKLVATHNSPFPATLGAAATIQGNNIHFAPKMDTDHNIKHEVAHAIDNKLHGTPKGDKMINGHKVDTTREKVVDTMVKNTQQVKGTNSKNSAKEEVSDSPVQRLPFVLNQVTKKLRKGGFEFDDDAVTKEGDGNISRLTIEQMQYQGLDFNDVVFEVRGRILEGDIAQGVRLNIGAITGNNLKVGNKFYRVTINNLNINILLIKKIKNIGVILTTMIINGIIRWLPLPKSLRPNQISVPYSKYGLNMLGAGSEITIQQLQIDTLLGSIATRIGKGGYTGEEGEVQTQSRVEGSVQVNNLALNVARVPNRNQDEYETNVAMGNLTIDQRKKKLIKAGRETNKTARDQFAIANLDFTISQNRDNFNLNNLNFDNQVPSTIIIQNKGPFRNITIDSLQSAVNQNGTGNITANISITIKNLPLVNINFPVNVPITNWVVTLDDIYQQISVGLRTNYLPLPVETILSYIIDLRNPGVLRRTLEVFDPEIPNTDQDVITTAAAQGNQPERSLGINIARLFEYHAASKIRGALGR
ncbi:hypothetical protein U6A24_01145 [Aquimarina gracilis]|uniref:DUF4157 domain-containing protein n=1 Tax=Aquimarina gracilis TaxID=874422 RepID=A0ABU5ZQV9_9FLAO|nr:hypothetical protein [Aquimarina gracilis]MEB3344043.1 hypothetical protein [Aquimarina gracilis]